MRGQQEAMGGCLCGEVRYRVNGQQLRGTICHRQICRKWGGRAVLAWTLLDLRGGYFALIDFLGTVSAAEHPDDREGDEEGRERQRRFELEALRLDILRQLTYLLSSVHRQITVEVAA